MTTLTAAQQDYIETVYRLEERKGHGQVRVSDIAAELGTRLPTVTRTINRLTALGLLRHVQRQAVSLSPSGRRIAGDIVHRHDDLLQFFTVILGLNRSQAERDVCQVEHGVSAVAARRLHEFLEHFLTMESEEQARVTAFWKAGVRSYAGFRRLSQYRTEGWRS
ncbi:MAG: metal-dependent transcriptional regulator [Candidatus Zixiibacteriota bacterium]